jgi:hypothetical protein
LLQRFLAIATSLDKLERPLKSAEFVLFLVSPLFLIVSPLLLLAVLVSFRLSTAL